MRHFHDGLFSCGEVVAQVDQRGADVAELTLAGADVYKRQGLSKGCAIVLCPISLKTAAFLDTLLKFLYNEHGGVVRPAL